MDFTIRARYFRVSAKPQDAPADLPDMLLAEMKKPVAERERDITGTGVWVRVEECATDGEFVAGQFCRKQIENIPPQAGPDGLEPIVLEGGKGLGHLGAFRYHRPTRVLLLQQNILSASPRRIQLYLAAANAAAIFVLEPVLREDALERFKDQRVRTFTVGFASTQNLSALDDRNIPSVKGAKLLAKAYDGLDLTITIRAGKGRGKKRKFLNFSRIKKDVAALLGSDVDVSKLEIATASGDQDTFIDFIEEHLKAETELTSPESDPSKHYQVRRNFLKAEFQSKLSYLMKHFGPDNGDHG